MGPPKPRSPAIWREAKMFTGAKFASPHEISGSTNEPSIFRTVRAGVDRRRDLPLRDRAAATRGGYHRVRWTDPDREGARDRRRRERHRPGAVYPGDRHQG